jgi:hypothetical protein
MNIWKRHSNKEICHGGFKCPYCGNASKGDSKRRHNRRVRARLKAELRQELNVTK